MKTKLLSYNQAFDDDNIWLSEIDNHWNEIIAFRQKLSKWTKVVESVEMEIEQQHFDLQFRILEMQMTNLKQKIKRHHHKLHRLPFKSNELLNNIQQYWNHESLRREIGAFRIMYLENQREFYVFLDRCKQVS